MKTIKEIEEANEYLEVQEAVSPHENDDQTHDLTIFGYNIQGLSEEAIASKSKELLGTKLTIEEVTRALIRENIRYNLANIAGDDVLQKLILESAESITSKKPWEEGKCIELWEDN